MSELDVEPDLDAGPIYELAQARPTHVRYQVLAFACALAVVTYIHRIGFAVGAPAIGVSLGLSQSQIGYLMPADFRRSVGSLLTGCPSRSAERRKARSGCSAGGAVP